MKRKIGTLLDEKLVIKAKQRALSEDRSLSELFEAAMRTYLQTVCTPISKTKNIVESTRGMIKMSPARLKAVMEEDLYERGPLPLSQVLASFREVRRRIPGKLNLRQMIAMGRRD